MGFILALQQGFCCKIFSLKSITTNGKIDCQDRHQIKIG